MSTNPGDLETYEEEIVEDGSAKLEHVFCGVCYPSEKPASTLCGTPVEQDWRTVEPGTPLAFDPCVVCFAGPSLTCTGCGTVIQCRP